MSAWQYLVKWAVLLLLVVVVARTDLGNRIVYYAIWLMIVLLLVTHAGDLTAVVLPEQLGQK